MARGRPRKDAAGTVATTPTASRQRANKQPQVPFVFKLVLNQWFLSLFNVRRFEELTGLLRREDLEGVDENKIHHYHHVLTAQPFNLTILSADLLLEYDQNIVKHTMRLNEQRITHGNELVVWKYFQYLALLFTEIYLDHYFRVPETLRTSLNGQIASYNEDKSSSDQLKLLDENAEAWSQLNKLAFWMATGSGKTLVMHANILQYQHYLEKHRRNRELNRIILLTPNEGLSQQHLREFETAGIEAEIFHKNGRGLFTGKAIEILEITKIREEMGDKTVAVDAFEGNNLVLVDEGHRGASGGGDGAWLRFRNQLCEKGFSFEYSATFGQAIKGNANLCDLYAKNILFDYSYRYFYRDGFGKDYQILNLDEMTQRDHLDLYLTACLLSFYQQQKLYTENESAFRPFQIEKPLWIFVGGSVTATLATRDASDIVEILKFLARYVADRTQSSKLIERVLNQGVVTATLMNLFAGRFACLNKSGLDPAQMFDETLAMLFNAPGGGKLYIENLKGATGEVALRLGAGEMAFGVINVGDDAKLVKICQAIPEFITKDSDFSGSLFHEINQPHSPVNLLIGSKKFTEGWNSWRVSTMGLMNVGKGEGAQIIQLFGRGVRLKGYEMSLKRSACTQLPDGVVPPKQIGVLETLGIFGIHADYMAQFRDFLKEEGLPTNDDRTEILLPVIKNLGTKKLKTIRIKKTINGVSTEFGDAFRKLGPIPTVRKPDPVKDSSTVYLQKNAFDLNWYPKIQAMKSGGLGGDAHTTPNQTHLTQRHVAFLDLDRLCFDLERFKAERGWYNLNLTRENIQALLVDQSWYRLLIPAAELAFDSFDRVRMWEEIALALLKKYMKQYYGFCKQEWEKKHLEYRFLEENDPNFLCAQDSTDEEGYYRILIDRSQEEIVVKLEQLKDTINNGKLLPWEFQGMKAIWFQQHLYQPLLYLESNIVEISPAPLNKGERIFVEDLKAFHDGHTDFFKGKELYLLRNLSKGRGMGFFEAGNFHPDFILWLLIGGRQYIIFVDPKGIRNLSPSDPKIRFFETIKEIEHRLGDTNVHLHSFIISNTPAHTMWNLWGMEKAEMVKRHILFQEEDKKTYVRSMLDAIGAIGVS